MRPDRQRPVEPGDQGQGRRHRLRSEDGGGGCVAGVRAQCRPVRVRSQLRRRRQDNGAQGRRRAVRVRAEVRAGVGPRVKDTDALRQKINFIELNRDDKANRFVVTWNAFQDGNRLAYSSLAIAIAVDGLVFLSGCSAPTRSARRCRTCRAPRPAAPTTSTASSTTRCCHIASRTRASSSRPCTPTPACRATPRTSTCVNSIRSRRQWFAAY